MLHALLVRLVLDPSSALAGPSAAATPWTAPPSTTSRLVTTGPPVTQTPCHATDPSTLAVVPIHLSTGALVFVEISEWEAAFDVGLATGDRTCNGSARLPEPKYGGRSATLARWLPAGSHRVSLVSPHTATAVVRVTATTPGHLVDHGMHPALAEAALHAADHAWTDNHAARSTLAIADFSRPSTDERLWVVDLATGQLRHHLFLTHGKGSGHRRDATQAVRFSNRPNSNQTSLGLFRASETYTGDHGRSMRLDGLEPGVNDLARDRAIVMHGAEYARVDHIAEWGYLGRSHGCPAIDDRVAQALIDDLNGGGLLYAWAGAQTDACCTLRAGTEAAPTAPYQPDPLGLVSIY